jgi:Fur family ferric uptake transcriptional regulator
LTVEGLRGGGSLSAQLGRTFTVSEMELETVDVAVSPTEKYREFLATKGLRMTRERSIIIDEVFSSHEHFEAEQLVQRLARRSDGKRVSRSTIYRSIKHLEEAGLIRKIARQDDRDLYEHDYGYPQHDHLICDRCGGLIEFHNEQISEILEQVAREHGFRVNAHRLEVSGLCKTCCRPPQTRPKKLNLL